MCIFIWPTVLVSRTSVTKYHKFDAWENKNLFSHSSGVRSLKSRQSCSPSEGSGGGSFLAFLTSGSCWQPLVSLVCQCIALTSDPIISLLAFSLRVREQARCCTSLKSSARHEPISSPKVLSPVSIFRLKAPVHSPCLFTAIPIYHTTWTSYAWATKANSTPSCLTDMWKPLPPPGSPSKIWTV